MISKKIYVPVVAGIISLLAITDFMSIVFGNYFLNTHIDQTFIKYVLLFFIPIMEVSYTKKFALEIVGWITSFAIYICILFNTMHWFDIRPYVIIALIVLLIIFIKNHIDRKRLRYLNLLFQLFFFIRIIIILSKPSEVLWWVDQSICFAILMASIMYLTLYIKNQSIERAQ
ncbi:hypothetical protein [Dokdonia sp.]|uniref:hypothetical protein n=1 Tax=Dokdonia sp. TaxID=2024995 RepID=UPI0032653BED